MIVNGYRIEPGADLTRANLTGADLAGANLRDADLTGANLYGADLTGADLAGANLRDATLAGANLRDADLYGAKLAGANLRGATLAGANLYSANLADADLADADLAGANFALAAGIADRVIIGGTRADGYAFLLTRTEPGEWRVKAGCRRFALTEAWAHWSADGHYRDPKLGAETRTIIAAMVELATQRGWSGEGENHE